MDQRGITLPLVSLTYQSFLNHFIGWHSPCTYKGRAPDIDALRRHWNTENHRHVEDKMMSNEVVQDWTDSTVLLKFGEHKDVRYKVYWDGAKLLQEITDPDDSPIHTLELPPGLVMEKQSYEVLLRYVLLDVVHREAKP